MERPLVIVAAAALVVAVIGFVFAPRPQAPIFGPGGFEVPAGFTKESESAEENYVIATYSGKDNLERAIQLFSEALRRENWTPIGTARVLNFTGTCFERGGLVALVSGNIEGGRVHVSVVVGPKQVEQGPPEENVPQQENEQPPEIRSLSFYVFLENQDIRRVDVYARNLNTRNVALRMDVLYENGARMSYILDWELQTGWTRFENENWRTFESVGMNFAEFWKYYSMLVEYATSFARVYPGQQISYSTDNVRVTFGNISINPVLPESLFRPI
jgi:hypothetical protein